VRWPAQFERTEAEPPLPHRLLPLENNGAGDHYCIDLSDPRDPVVWSHEAAGGVGHRPDVVAPTFVEWALALFENNLL
jgi:hypothetical protein